MKIRTRSALLSTVALAAVATAVSVPGTAQAEFGFTNTKASVGSMQASVISQMQGNAFGWQLAIAQDGELKITDKRGTAISQADTGGNSVAMQPTMRMELASVTKNITAVATMKLLRRNNLTVESLVHPYLPAAWDESDFKTVKFKHLLTHTSGINQAINAMPEGDRPPDNSWDSMEIVVENGTTVNSQRQYKNANFALLRVINAKLWDLSGGAKYVTYEEEIENSHGAVIETKEITEKLPVTEANHTSYVLDYMRKHIFQPAGLQNVGCIPSGTTTGVRSYPVNATQSSKGSVLGTNSGECAGARGIALSAVELTQYLTALRHGSIINPADLATMDLLRAGWDEDSNGGDGGENGVQNGVPDNWRSPGAFWHGGDLLGTNELHTCAMTFADGTEATLLVNSELDAGANGPCGVLIRAWYGAKP